MPFLARMAVASFYGTQWRKRWNVQPDQLLIKNQSALIMFCDIYYRRTID